MWIFVAFTVKKCFPSDLTLLPLARLTHQPCPHWDPSGLSDAPHLPSLGSGPLLPRFTSCATQCDGPGRPGWENRRLHPHLPQQSPSPLWALTGSWGLGVDCGHVLRPTGTSVGCVTRHQKQDPKLSWGCDGKVELCPPPRVPAFLPFTPSPLLTLPCVPSTHGAALVSLDQR